MVSFQCHGCGDVVKKPKLDQHRARCHTGFDCIDCSKTFNTPADYKGHTSCISEAEKYQKSLYKGPKTTDAPKNNYPPQPPSQYPEGSWNQGRGRGGFRGGRGGGRGGWGQPQSRGTGANDTPLGTPRMSPFVPSPPGQATPTNVETPAQDGSLAPSLSKDKTKKRKADDSVAANGDGPSNKKAKVVTNGTAVDPASIPLPSSPSPEDKKKEKKKSKKAKDDEGAVKEKEKKKKDKRAGDEVAVTDLKEEKKKKKEKRDKKNKGEDCDTGEVQDIEMAAPLENKRKKDKRKEGEVQTSLVTEIATEETDGKSSKKGEKKKKRDRSEKREAEQAGEQVQTPLVTEPATENKASKKEKKKRDKAEKREAEQVDGQVEEKKKKHSESLPSGDIDANSIPVAKVIEKEKKSKKEKRKQADAVSAS